MFNNGLVSIIIPFFNSENFIEEAIESVLTQTYDNWELLLVDDGSTDGSSKIAMRYAEQYPGKVWYLEHEGHQNRGASAARNVGIRHAKGKLIAFLDADDVWLPQKLEQQETILKSHPEAAMVFGSVKVWYSWTENSKDSERDFVIQVGVHADSLIKPPKLLPILLESKELLPLPSIIMIRREIIQRIGGFEEAFVGIYQQYEDSAFSAKVFLNEYVYISSVCWIKYRQHPDSHTYLWMKTEQYRPDKLNSVRLFFLNWALDYLIEQDTKNTDVWQALRKAFWPYRHAFIYRLSNLSTYLVNKVIFLLNKILLLILKFIRSVFEGKTGSIKASPNPVKIQGSERFLVALTTISWTFDGTEMIEVHIGSPDGPLFASSESSGSAITGRWVHDGMIFYLQDASGKNPFSFANTLDAVKVRVISTVS